MLEGFLPTEMLVLVRFHRWEDVLKLPRAGRSRARQRMRAVAFRPRHGLCRACDKFTEAEPSARR